MGVEDYFHDFYDCYEDYEPSPNEFPTCNRCGKLAAGWKETSKGFRLIESNGQLHKCDPIARARSDFA
jgi:hypothetical protein